MSTLNRTIVTRNRIAAYCFLAPNFLGFLLFQFVPIVASLALCFVRWDGQNAMEFVGLGNFARMFTDSTFRITLSNTLVYSFFSVLFVVTFALILAMMLSRTVKGIGVVRAIQFIPYISSVIAVAAVWQFLLHPNLGPVNLFLMRIGIENPPRWFASTDYAMASVIVVSVWRNAGYYMVILLAGINGIPQVLYEAAITDGANGWQRFRHVTLPMLSPTMFFVTVIAVINSFKVFNTIYALTQGGPGRSTSVLVYQIYKQGFKFFQFGYASAQAFVLFIFILIFTLIQFRIQNKWVNYSL